MSAQRLDLNSLHCYNRRIKVQTIQLNNIFSSISMILTTIKNFGTKRYVNEWMTVTEWITLTQVTCLGDGTSQSDLDLESQMYHNLFATGSLSHESSRRLADSSYYS